MFMHMYVEIDMCSCVYVCMYVSARISWEDDVDDRKNGYVCQD